MSLDAYRRNVGGSITIAVTGTDNPVPSQLSERKTPPQPAPAVQDPTEPAVDTDTATKKSRKKKKS